MPKIAVSDKKPGIYNINWLLALTVLQKCPTLDVGRGSVSASAKEATQSVKCRLKNAELRNIFKKVRLFEEIKFSKFVFR